MNNGTILAQYRIVEKLGEGGMGAVYRAEDTRLERDVAIKLLPPDVAGDEDRLARLVREARVLARLDHPNIAAIYGIEEAVPECPPGGDGATAANVDAAAANADVAGVDQVRFLVMQLAEGETLEALLDRRGGAPSDGRVQSDAVTAVPSPTMGAGETDGASLRYRGLPLDEALSIAAAVAEALDAAHQQGIIHRDLKPANVKVALDRGRPQVKVLDFGLAKVYQAEDEDSEGDPSASPTMLAATEAGMIMGTAGYMSPEQARGQRVDQRTDIWAFGVLLYELLTGRRLFHGDTVSDTLAAVLKDEIELRALPENTPLPVRRLLRRCLRRDVHRRLHNIADGVLEIDEAREGLLGEDAGDVEKLLGASQMKKDATADDAGGGRFTLSWLHALAGALLLAAGVGVGVIATPGVAPPDRDVRIFGDLGPPAARSGVISPDGTKLAVHIGEGLWVRDFDSLDVRFIENSNEHRGRPFWSPDSRFLGFLAQGGLYVAETDDGTSRRLEHDVRVSGSTATWGPEGIVASAPGRGGGRLVMLDPDSEEWRDVARNASGVLRHPAFLPDGQTLVYEFGERREGAVAYGTVIVQRGLAEDAPTEIIIEHEDQFVGFHYVEELEVLLAESLYTGIWSVPLSPDGSNVGIPQPLLPNGEDMTLSRDGTFAYRSLENRLDTEPFRWIDRSGRATQTEPSGKRDVRWLALSPGGDQVAFMAPRAAGQAPDLWVLDLVRGAETRITAEPGAGDMPAWRGNDRLVFVGSLERGRATTLYEQAASGAGDPEVIAEGGLFRHPASSADGRFVAFEALSNGGEFRSPLEGGDRGRGGRGSDGGRGEPGQDGGRRDPGETGGSRPVWNIYYVGPGDSAPVVYRATDDNETKPAPSPNGNLIAYISDTSGSNEVWVDTFPEPSEPVRVSVAGGGNVRWSGSGDELIYDDGDDTLWSVGVDTRASHGREAFAAPERLFEEGDAATRFARFGSRSWDIRDDGDAVFTIQRYAEGISYVNVIENFARWYRERR